MITSGGVSVGDYDYMSAALERIAADDPDEPLAGELVPGGDPSGEAALLRRRARAPRVRASGEPRVVAGELRTVRAAGAPHDDGAHRARSARRSPHAAEHAFRRKPDGKLHLDRVTVRVDDGRYVVASVGKQESNTLAATALADALVLLPDGEGVDEGDDVCVMLLD